MIEVDFLQKRTKFNGSMKETWVKVVLLIFNFFYFLQYRVMWINIIFSCFVQISIQLANCKLPIYSKIYDFFQGKDSINGFHYYYCHFYYHHLPDGGWWNLISALKPVPKPELSDVNFNSEEPWHTVNHLFMTLLDW